MNKLATTLSSGGVAVIPTDTIYGIVGRALNPKTVERIYKIKKRRPDKPFIVLIAEIGDLEQFGIKITPKTTEILNKYLPGQVSIILDCPNSDLEYLHRGTNSLAFRLPDKEDLQELIKQTGPLVAPSANPEGETPASTIDEAKNYFGDQIDFYQDAGELKSEPSTLIKITNNKIEVLRQGAVPVL